MAQDRSRWPGNVCEGMEWIDVAQDRRRWPGNVCEGMEWIDVAQDRSRWRSVLNPVMNVLVP